MNQRFSEIRNHPFGFIPEGSMALDRLWTPTVRCVRCRRLCPLQGLKAWVFQPVTLDGGVVHFECRRCRPPEMRGFGRSGQSFNGKR